MKKPEAWMTGPVANIPLVLQPVAHALIQALDETVEAMHTFEEERLWIKPAGMASVGFHLQHLRGVIDRLFTYARAEALTSEQLTHLQQEGIPVNVTPQRLVKDFSVQVELALGQLRETAEHSVFESRGIGRKQLPTNVLGLLFHAAEHTQRHVGQLLVTVKWVSTLEHNQE